MAVFAPSGVAAGNANGFTFHNGLRSRLISRKQLLEEPSRALISKLVQDFAPVVCIIVDEFSMTSLVLLEYLDKVMRLIRPAFSDVFFSAVPLILAGDAFQLPVVGGHGILSPTSCISEHLQRIHAHCTEHVYYLGLTESVRQNDDLTFSMLLHRMRMCKATQDDAIAKHSLLQ